MAEEKAYLNGIDYPYLIKARPQTVSFTRNNNSSVQTADTSYDLVAKVEYLGSDVLGVPDTIDLNAWNDGGTSISIEIQDITNGNQIAEATLITSSSEANIEDLGTLSNVPTGPAVFEIRMLLVGGGMGDQAKASTFSIYEK